MDYRLLGPLSAQAKRGEIALGGPRQRLVLALLLLRANEVVTVDELVDEVWGDEPPTAARSSLYAYVSRLRKALGHDRLVDGPGGYVLKAGTDEIDARRFEAALDEARRLLLGDPGRAATVLDDALGIWRGAPISDLADEPALQPEIARLHELRLSALEARVDAGLALGRHDELIAQLERLLAEEPLRERYWGQLMVALYRSGRQGDALKAYLRARAVLTEQLGVEPSPELERLQRQILQQDPELDTIGRRVRGYELRERIGSGAFGTVYRALQPELGREVAVKVVHARLANDADFIRQFEREAQLVAQLEHPHVVPLYDYWRERAARTWSCATSVAATCGSASPPGESSPVTRRSASSTRSPWRWELPTGAGSSTATSARRTSSSTRTAMPISPTSASPDRSPRLHQPSLGRVTWPTTSPPRRSWVRRSRRRATYTAWAWCCSRRSRAAIHLPIRHPIGSSSATCAAASPRYLPRAPTCRQASTVWSAGRRHGARPRGSKVPRPLRRPFGRPLKAQPQSPSPPASRATHSRVSSRSARLTRPTSSAEKR